jgi:hypothetical protein
MIVTSPKMSYDIYCFDIGRLIMSEEQYNELLKAYTKEALANMIKADIRNRFLSLMPVCIANSLTTLKMLGISLNLQQS